MADHVGPSETPNVVINDPQVRKYATAGITIASVIVGAASVLDLASEDIDWASVTTPASALVLFLAGVFGVAVTLPNVPRK